MQKLGLVVGLSLLLTVAAQAHDGELFLTFDSFDVQQSVHEDDFPFKGQVFVQANNNSGAPWNGFEFFLFTAPVQGASALENVYFAWSEYPVGNPMPDPVANIMSTFDIDNVAKTLSYSFGGWVQPGQTVNFTFYTDNTIDQGWFGLAMYPVPEPATLALLGIGGLALLRRRRR